MSPLPGTGLRVLVVLNGLGTGGAERSTAELLPKLADDEIEVTVACLFRRREGVQNDVVRAGHDVRFLRSRSMPGRVRELRALLDDVRPDLVHTAVFESDLAGRLAAWRRAPVLSSVVNSSYDPIRRQDPNVHPLRLEAVRRIDGWTARHLTTHFHAVAEAVKESAVRDLGVPSDRVTVVYRGRDPARLARPTCDRRASIRETLGLADDTPLVLAVGRQEWQKGYVDLLAAVAQLASRTPGVVTLIAGRAGNATPDITRAHEALRSAGLGDQVRFLGHRDDVPDLLAAADCLALPSRYEGIAGAAIEAMALGVPVVASDLPSITEAVEDQVSGLLVPPADPAALARALETVLTDRERARGMGARGRQRFLERFTLEQSARGMADLYRRVADRHLG
jgi:glycosyltransferase involved in cell wall biosynthesis